jgi:hypothetical protein
MHWWMLWRDCYYGGIDFAYRHLHKFTTRESDPDFYNRRQITPIPSFAKTAINEVRNSIFNRMSDTIRRNGSEVFQSAASGLSGGVDLRGSSMNFFMGKTVLTELLVMGQVGIYVDMPPVNGPTLADTLGSRPYLYKYDVEDILSWSVSSPSNPSEFKALLLRDRGVDYHVDNLLGVTLPIGSYERFRLVWLDPASGHVMVRFLNTAAEPIDPMSGLPTLDPPIELALTRIPFVMIDSGESLMKDVANHQIALLNLGSSDVSYALKANFPFYTEQQDLRAIGDHLKMGASPDGTAQSGGQGSSDKELTLSATQGRAYDLKAERPGFIHPSPEPLRASIELQQKLEDDIRKLVHLSMSNKTGRAVAAEVKDMVQQGLEAGLAYVGSVLETAERKIADYWACYEENKPEKRRIAHVKYPTRYALSKTMDRVSEAAKLSDLITKVPGRIAKRELAKDLVTTLLGARIPEDQLQAIYADIDTCDYTTSDPETIIQAAINGLVGEQTASIALGFNDDEYLVAREDHQNRIERIAKAQTQGNETVVKPEPEPELEAEEPEAEEPEAKEPDAEKKEPNEVPKNTANKAVVNKGDLNHKTQVASPIDPNVPNPAWAASRGVKDLAVNRNAAKQEKADSRDTTLKEDKKVPVRGKGKKLTKES